MSVARVEAGRYQHGIGLVGAGGGGCWGISAIDISWCRGKAVWGWSEVDWASFTLETPAARDFSLISANNINGFTWIRVIEKLHQLCGTYI